MARTLLALAFAAGTLAAAPAFADEALDKAADMAALKDVCSERAPDNAGKFANAWSQVVSGSNGAISAAMQDSGFRSKVSSSAAALRDTAKSDGGSVDAKCSAMLNGG